MKKVVLVTGSSRGIGRLTALELAQRGHCVYATMRNPKSLVEPFENVYVRQLDVTKPSSIQKTVKEILLVQGRVDVVINNAGYALFAPVELASEEEISQQLDVNVIGAIRVIQAVLPSMRAQRSGHIINISSIAGIVSNPAVGVYCASKHALEAISASLASTVFPWNIKVTVVQPASTATEFGEAMALGERLEKENPYQEFVQRYRDNMIQKLKEGQPPEEVAQLICDIVETENPDYRYQTSSKAKEMAQQFVTDPTGNQWLDKQKELLSDWF